MAKIPANILKMALDAIDEPVAAIGRAVSDMPETAARALDDMAGAVDDWGWKGGKPGEITGGEFEYKRRQLGDMFNSILPKNRGKAYSLEEQLRKQVEGSGLENMDMVSLAGDFSDLEQADVPREWTGKIVRSLRKPLWEYADTHGEKWLGSTTPSGRPLIVMSETVARGISDAMRRMYVKGDPDLTRQYRETFLSLLPQWEGSLDDLAIAARSFVD